ncbi:helix-turn-helix domain-containing protein [Rhizobium rhizogenes]|uniref:helix-turn-helix domain-containing protein n=1 Tax=Rhizobium rhizogenes TaxID=359 RepID=UPI001571FA23|nr:helix-turn-helix transcriptional regulator [Rhizobium rhizogenes]NTG07205.1 helix-turn-helix transcriptional regulator [Rhizobium rhizogenes]
MQVKNVTSGVTIAEKQSVRILCMEKRQLGKHFLRQWRKHRGLSLRKLADRMEIEPGVPITSHANIGRIETFQQPYSQDIMEAAATALGCTVTDLLTVDPSKEGEVVDLLALIRSKDPETVKAILAGLPNARAS